jgi:hypothetical protein
MKKFKSISVDETTFEAVDRLSETLMPRIKLSKAQVVENLVKGSIEAEKNLNKLLDELTASWEKYNETLNKLKKKET